MAIKDKCNSVAYKSKFILVLTLFSMIFMISFVSAWDWDWDNYKNYIPENNTIEVWDKGFFLLSSDTKLAEYRLLENTDNCLTNCYAIGMAEIYEENKLFNNLKFYHGEILESKVYIEIEKTREDEITEWIEECNEIDSGGGNLTIVCEDVIDRMYNETVEWVEWEEYQDQDLLGEFKWKIEGKKNIRTSVDWIVSAYGQDFTEWAWWNTDWNRKRMINLTDPLPTDVNRLEYIELEINNITIRTNCNDELHLLNNSEDQVNRDIMKGNATACTIGFVVNKTSTQAERIFYAYYDNPFPSPPTQSSALEIENDNTASCMVSSEYLNITVEDSDTDGTFSGLQDIIFNGAGHTMHAETMFMGKTVVNETCLAVQEGDVKIKVTFGTIGSAIHINFSFYEGTQYVGVETSGYTADTGYGTRGELGGTTAKTFTYRDAVAGTYTEVTGATAGDWESYGFGDVGKSSDTFTTFYVRNESTITVNTVRGYVRDANAEDELLRIGSNSWASVHGNIDAWEHKAWGVVKDDDGMREDMYKMITNPMLYEIGDEEIFSTADISPTATLNIPLNDTNQSTSSVTFNYTCEDDWKIDNSSFYIDNVLNVTNIWGTSNITSPEFSLPFPDGSYLWSVNCSDNGTHITNSGMRSFTIDATNPVISGLWNLTNIITFDLPTSSNWSFNASDFHLESCWHNTTDNATIGMVTCNNTVITDWATEGTKIVYYYANDTFGNEVSTSTPINITFISSTYSHNPDAVGELGSIFFDLYVNTTETPTTTAYLWINNTRYDVDNKDAYTNYTYFNYSFFVPDGWGNSTGWEYDYYWNYSISGVLDNQSTATDNFTVYSMEMDNCSTFPIEILNFNLFDEESNELINASAGATIEVDVLMELGGGTWEFHSLWVDNETASVCVPEGTINNTNYTIGYTIGFDSTDRVWEFFYVDGGILDNANTLIDAQTNRTINLYDLLTADSTSFLFNFFDEDGLPVENSIVHVFRKYIGEGLFREVERARQDENGDTTIHLVEEDVIYYFVISLDGEILYTSSTYTALCQAVPCTIQIEASGDLIEFDEDWDLVANGSYSLTQSSLTRLVNLTYVFTESSDANLTLYRYDSDGDYVSIISGEETGTSGTISLLVPSSIGNKTFFATFYKDGEFINSEWISMEEDAGLYFGNSLALFLAFLVILCLGLMGISEGGATIVWVIIGMILTSALGLIDFATSTGVSLLIYFICAGAIIMWKLTRGRK